MLLFQAWLTEINEYAQEDVVIMLLGNKADMASERLIKTEDGEKLAKVRLQNCHFQASPEVIQLFSCSAQLSMKFFTLIIVKMPTIVGILTFICMIKTTLECLKAGKPLIF